MLFWNSLAFLMIQRMLAVWSLVPLPFLKPDWTSGSSQFVYCWSLTWRILSITLLACEMSAIVRQFEHSLALPFFGIGMKTDLFQSYGHCWVFQTCWHIECSTFTASSFRMWNSSTGMPSPPLGLFVVMLPKAQLTLHSRMSGSSDNYPDYLGCEDFFCTVLLCSCHLFLISSVSVKFVPFLSFIEPIFAWKVPLESLIFLKRSLVFLSHSIVFLYFFALITEEGFLISPCYSLELCIQMGISLLFFFAFSLSFFSWLFVRPLQRAILLFCISFSWRWLDPCIIYI